MQKVKFKVTIEKLSFEFEGAREMGQALQTGLTNTLGSLMKTQQTVLALPATPPAPTLFDAPANGELVIPPPAATVEKPKRANSRKPGQPTIPDRIKAMKAEGFFGVPRNSQAIEEHLKTTKAFNIRSSSLPGVLQKLTQDGELFRKSIEDVFHYQDKPFNESPRATDTPAGPSE